MAQEEVITMCKHTKWKVFRRIDGKPVDSIEETEPMTSSQALKHFNAVGLYAIEG